MPECLTYFPFDPHLITPAQRRTRHISHISTSLSVETLVSVRVENLTENTSMSKNLIIRRLSTPEPTLFLLWATKAFPFPHVELCERCYVQRGKRRPAEVDATHGGLCHLPAGVVDHSLSRQFAEHDLSHLIRVIISSIH